MTGHHRRWVVAAASITVILILLSVKSFAPLCRLFDYDLDIKESGESFPVGDLQVCTFFGYSDDGDRLRYAIYPSPGLYLNSTEFTYD